MFKKSAFAMKTLKQLLLVVSLSLAAASLRAAETQINFEDGAGLGGQSIGGYYAAAKGVTFGNAVWVAQGTFNEGNTPGQWRNGAAGLGAATGCYHDANYWWQSPCSTHPITATFSPRVTSVSITSFNPGINGVRLTAFDSDGNVVGTDQFIGQGAGTGTRTLQVTARSTPIDHIALDQPVFVDGNDDGVTFDDLSFAAVSSIEISTVTLSSGGDLKPDGTLDFAAGNDWGNTAPDKIQCSADTPGVQNPNIEWSVIELSSGTANPSIGTNSAYSFRITNLPAHDLYSPRQPIHFKIIAKLLDTSGSEIARDEKTVIQSELGARRQEYVDHPIDVLQLSFPKVPPAGMFENLEIHSAWANNAVAVVFSAAAALGVPTQVTSSYRSPVRNWQVGGTATSQHMWGTAVDFLVNNYNRRPGIDVNDYEMLRKVVKHLGYRVVPEGEIDHVHIQQFNPHTGRPYPNQANEPD
jgi:hypothetical protein